MTKPILILSGPEEEVVRLRAHGASWLAIADQLGIERNTIYSRLRRARARNPGLDTTGLVARLNGGSRVRRQ